MNKREKLEKLIKLAQEQGIIPADAILELGDLKTQELISKLDKIPEFWDATKLKGEIPADQLPLFTPTQRGAVPPPIYEGLILGSSGWENKPALPKTIVQSFGGGGGRGATGPQGSPGPNTVTVATSTNLTGLLMGNGANIQLAVAGVDYGDIFGTGVVGQVAEFVTNTKTLRAAKIIGPATNLLTITNNAPSTLAMDILNTFTLTASTDSELEIYGQRIYFLVDEEAGNGTIELDGSASNTYITTTLNTSTALTGGGTIVLGGYTFSIPASGTPALVSPYVNTQPIWVSSDQGSYTADCPDSDGHVSAFLLARGTDMMSGMATDHAAPYIVFVFDNTHVTGEDCYVIGHAPKYNQEFGIVQTHTIDDADRPNFKYVQRSAAAGANPFVQYATHINQTGPAFLLTQERWQRDDLPNVVHTLMQYDVFGNLITAGYVGTHQARVGGRLTVANSSEMVINGTGLTNTNGWTGYEGAIGAGGSLTAVGGALRVTQGVGGTAWAAQYLDAVIGNTYTFTYTISNPSAGYGVYVGDGLYTDLQYLETYNPGAGVHTIDFVAIGTTINISLFNYSGVGDSTDFSAISLIDKAMEGHFGHAAVAQQAFCDFSNPPTQAECRALRDKLINLGFMAAS